MEKKGWKAWVWLTFSGPPQSRARYQAKNAAHMDTRPRYPRPTQALAGTGAVGQVVRVMGRLTGSVSRVTQQITRSAPMLRVTLAPCT